MQKRLNPENWKIRVLRSDRNEVRYHVFSGLLTVLYKNKAGLTAMYEWAKTQRKEVLIAVSEEYHKKRMEGA